MANINQTIRKALRNYNPVMNKNFEIRLNILKYRLSLSLVCSIDKYTNTSKVNANNDSEHNCNQEHFENRLFEYFQSQQKNAQSQAH
ncbi:hypothetical protein B0A78_03405 [Flavobacterium columnare NBRC 100251 = ATCC 23463]|nr:hypothetical protein B0A78_03405 [Flavobacterium columnare NBRC 100251 = ATCC 23463]QHJ72905.1 hypothetical protein [Flavobacterium phage fF4]GEM58408.1 hypothetical protein FC1_16460 [Flavobacterium columnare NBRC 100251 = ATCC 23463]